MKLEEKARKLIRENEVKLDLNNFKNSKIYFTVKGKYSVIKNHKGYSCTCFYSSVKSKMCSHILAVKMIIENKYKMENIWEHLKN